VAAVSGGPDSMALLCALERLSRTRDWHPVAAHLNHRGHDRSDEAESRLRTWCRAHGVPLVAASVVDPARLEEGRGGYEARARRLRRDFYRRAARAVNARHVLLAHHRDDQVETLLLNLGRGCGLFGLEGMRPVDRLGDELKIVRPFLEVPRETLRGFARENDLPFVDDPTNASVERARNRLRHEVLPAWEAGQPDPRSALHRLSRRAREENRFWERFLDDRFRTWWWNDECQVDLACFRDAHPAAQRRLLHRVLYRLTGSGGGVSERNVNDLRQLFLSGSSGRRLSLPGGCRAIREYGRGAVYRPATGEAYRRQLPRTKREMQLAGAGRLCWSENASCVLGGEATLVSEIRLRADAPVVVRPWEPGDRLAGGEASATLKDRFHRERVPFRARRRWPLLLQDDRVVGAPGLSDRAGGSGVLYRFGFRAEAPCFHQYLTERSSNRG